MTGRDRGAHQVIELIETRRRELVATRDAHPPTTTRDDQPDGPTPLRTRFADLFSRTRFDADS